MLRGRFFTPQDRADSPPVAVIDDELAQRFFGDADPIGRRVAFPPGADQEPRWLEIVGVVGHVKQDALDGETRVQLYVPVAQLTNFATLTLAVRSEVQPAALVPRVRDIVRRIDPSQPLSAVATMDELMGASLTPRRLTTRVLAAFAALALVLAVIGVYGVMAQLVTERTRELGVRMALGADRYDVLRLVLRQGLTLTAAGLGLGFGASLLASRLVTSQLYQVGPADPTTLVAVAGLLAAAATAATLLPALRAARVHPSVALRQE